MHYPFTVLLQRPDYIADDSGTDTYQAHITTTSDDVQAAVEVAQREAFVLDFGPKYTEDWYECLESGARASDYLPLLVCRGHIENFV